MGEKGSTTFNGLKVVANIKGNWVDATEGWHRDTRLKREIYHFDLPKNLALSKNLLRLVGSPYLDYNFPIIYHLLHILHYPFKYSYTSYL